jgi:tRNA (cytidine32/guanosine34-2'-O)-methyltransferase
MQLVIAGLNMALHILEKGGSFVAKVFRGKDFIYLVKLLKKSFKEVYLSKPKSCRNSSIEGFIVCRNFSPTITVSDSLNPNDCLSVLNVLQDEESYFSPTTLEETIDFVSVGDESSLDADKNYPLSYELTKGKPYKYLEPLQKPIDPPYMEYLKD